MSTQELVTSIIAEQEESTDQFVDILQQKIEDAIEVKRIELASQMFEASKKCPECGKADCECDDEEEDDMEEMDEEFEQIDEKVMVGDKVKIHYKGSQAHGMVGRVEDIYPDEGGTHAKVRISKGTSTSVPVGSLKRHKKISEEAEQIDEGGNYGTKYDPVKHIASMTNKEIEKRISDWEEFKQKNPNMPHRVTHDQLAMLRAERASRIGKKKTNEEAEQIDEISNQTKRAYMGSAVADLTSRSLKHGSMFGKKKYRESDLAKYQSRKIMNRQMGIARVSDALVKKEEFEHMDEQFTLHAVHDEMGTKKKLGSFASKGEAAAHLNKLEKAGKFPEGHEAVLTDKNGQKHMYTDKWEQMDEMAPPGAKYERMVKHIKKGYSKDGLTKNEKSIAYATAWKAKNREVNEAAMTDAQQMSALGMKGAERAKMMMAVSAYRRHGDINKLSAAHRTLVASYAEKTGGLGAVNRSAAIQALKKERMQEE